MTQLTLYFAPLSCAFIPLVALEEIGCRFEVKVLALMAGEHRRAEYLALNPKGKVPTLVIDGRPLTENVAILTWLSGRFPETQLLPDPGDFDGRVAVLSDLAYLASTLQPFAPRIRLPQRYCDTDPARSRDQAVAAMRPQLDWIEARLAGRPPSEGPWWFGERWSLVDVHLDWIWSTASRPPGMDEAAYPHISRHAAEGRARPAVQRALRRQEAALADLAARGLVFDEAG